MVVMVVSNSFLVFSSSSFSDFSPLSLSFSLSPSLLRLGGGGVDDVGGVGGVGGTGCSRGGGGCCGGGSFSSTETSGFLGGGGGGGWGGRDR